MYPNNHSQDQDSAESTDQAESKEEFPQNGSIRATINKDPSSIDDPDVSSATEYLQKRRLLAVTDSLLMISHAAENGLDLKKEDVKAILDMAGKIDTTGKPTSEGQLTSE